MSDAAPKTWPQNQRMAIAEAQDKTASHVAGCECLDCAYLNHSVNCKCQLCKEREKS